jgi:hypothetical protein
MRGIFSIMWKVDLSSRIISKSRLRCAAQPSSTSPISNRVHQLPSGPRLSGREIHALKLRPQLVVSDPALDPKPRLSEIGVIEANTH